MNLGGTTLVLRANYSLQKILSTTYPECEWLPWKFQNVSILNPENWKHFLEVVAKKLDIKELSDWNKVKPEQLIDLGGGILLVKNHSLSNLLSIIYSEFKWDKNLFSQAEADIWNDKHLANYFVEWLKQSGNEISEVQQVVKDMGNNGILLVQLLKTAFPTLKWYTLSLSSKKSQYMLKECISQLFTGKNALLLEEYKHPDISNLELDYFLPQYNLAFEYQGQQHYRNVQVFHQLESIDTLKNRDKRKYELCKELGITLIEVPYWWDRKLSSLAATVYNARPDLFEDKPQGNPIPLTLDAPKEASKQIKLSKEFLMTATEWDNSTMEPKGWFMTEKYDGMRLYWDGKKFLSRNGRPITIPKSLTKQLPSVALDGELWTQYGLYQDAINLAKSLNEEKWGKAIFWIFDSPNMSNQSLEERIEFLQKLKLPSWAKVVEFVECEGKEHLQQFNDAILKKGGEGVMLREPGSLYKAGRSISLRRFKPFFDTEVLVLKNQFPHGFQCQQLNGKTLFVNLPEDYANVAKRIKAGSVITVKHSGTNAHGTLLYPQFYRERLDVKWNDLNKTL